MAKAIRNFHCDFHDALCEDSRCKRGLCIEQTLGEKLFAKLPEPTETPEQRAWSKAFAKERREVIKLACRVNKVRYSAEIGRKYLNDFRVVNEALRRMKWRSSL